MGAISERSDNSSLAPIFFTVYLPLLNVSWLLKVALNVVLLRQGRWQRWTRVADFSARALVAGERFVALTAHEIMHSADGKSWEEASLPSLRKSP